MGLDSSCCGSHDEVGPCVPPVMLCDLSNPFVGSSWCIWLGVIHGRRGDVLLYVEREGRDGKVDSIWGLDVAGGGGYGHGASQL